MALSNVIGCKEETILLTGLIGSFTFDAGYLTPRYLQYKVNLWIVLLGISVYTTSISAINWTDVSCHSTAHWCSKGPEVPVFAYQTWRAAKVRYEHGERIYYSCKPGFIMVGIPMRQCVMGQWSPLRFKCSGKYSPGWGGYAIWRKQNLSPVMCSSSVSS